MSAALEAWVERRNGGGHLYYVHEATGETRWIKPSFGGEAAARPSTDAASSPRSPRGGSREGGKGGRSPSTVAAAQASARRVRRGHGRQSTAIGADSADQLHSFSSSSTSSSFATTNTSSSIARGSLHVPRLADSNAHQLSEDSELQQQKRSR